MTNDRFHEMNIEMDNQYMELVKQNRVPSFFVADSKSFEEFFIGLRLLFFPNVPYSLPEKIDLNFPSAGYVPLYPIKAEKTFVKAVVLD